MVKPAGSRRGAWFVFDCLSVDDRLLRAGTERIGGRPLFDFEWGDILESNELASGKLRIHLLRISK